MREIKVPGEVRQLVKRWREQRNALTFAVQYPINKPYRERLIGERKALADCANELEAALKRPVQLLRKRNKLTKPVK